VIGEAVLDELVAPRVAFFRSVLLTTLELTRVYGSGETSCCSSASDDEPDASS
jgi:hypothetical protein